MDNGNINNQDYQIVLIDVLDKRIFVTRKPIVPKDKDEEMILRISEHVEQVYFPGTYPDFNASDCEVVDITDWEYESLEDLSYKINNYESSPPKKIKAVAYSVHLWV